MAERFINDGNSQASDGVRTKRRALAELLMRNAMSTQPVGHWTQGLARFAQGAVGLRDLYRDEEARSKGGNPLAHLQNAAMTSSQAAPAASPLLRAGANPGEAPVAQAYAPLPRRRPAELDRMQSVGPGDIMNMQEANPTAGATRPSPANQPSGPSARFIATILPHAQRVAAATGLDPRLIIAQAALESSYGRRAPGNNYFGIKSHGRNGGNDLSTTEVINGQPIRTRANFRAYGDLGESVDDYGRFLQSNRRYRGVLGARGLDAQIAAMAASGYATDPHYGRKLREIAAGVQIPNEPTSEPVRPPRPDGATLRPQSGLPAPDIDAAFADTQRMQQRPEFEQIRRGAMWRYPGQLGAPLQQDDSSIPAQMGPRPGDLPGSDIGAAFADVERMRQRPAPGLGWPQWGNPSQGGLGQLGSWPQHAAAPAPQETVGPPLELRAQNPGPSAPAPSGGGWQEQSGLTPEEEWQRRQMSPYDLY